MIRRKLVATLDLSKAKGGSFIQIALILGFAWLVYAPGLEGGFIFDDIANLLDQDNWRLTEWTAPQIERVLNYGISSPTGRPLALLSFALNHYFTGLDPYWLKAGSLLLHILNTLLVWLIFQHLLRMTKLSKAANQLALMLAAVWALHPLQVSTVMYIVQRMEIGAATGTLLALATYLRARAEAPCSKRWFAWLAVTAVALFSGLLFKETGILACGYAFLIEVTLLKFRNPDGSRSAGWKAFYLVGATGAALAAVWMWPNDPSREFTLLQRALSQGPVLVTYLGQIIFPLLDSMRFYYDDFPISTSLISPPFTLVAWCLLASLVAIAIYCRRLWPLTTLGIGWFFMAHAATSSVVMLELAFEHRNYLALLGVALALTQPLASLFQRIAPSAAAPAAVALILGLAAMTNIQARIWSDPALLAYALERRAPTSTRASYAYGTVLLYGAKGDPNSPMWALARRQWEAAAALPGDSALALSGLIILDGQAGVAVPHSTWEQLRTDLHKRALSSDAVNGLKTIVDCRINRDCTLDDGELIATLASTLERNPHDLMLHMVYANFAANGLGDLDLAIRIQREVIVRAPNDPGQRLALAAYLISADDARSRAEAFELVEAMEQTDRDGRLAEPLVGLRKLLARSSTPPPAAKETTP